MYDRQLLIGTCFLWFGALTLPPADGFAADWPVFGRDHTRNAVSPETNPPTEWDVESGRNIRWQAEIASFAFGAPAVSDGLVWIGGNSWRPGDDQETKDAAVLYCFDEQTGEKLYEYVSPRLERVTYYTDPIYHGLGCSPVIEGDRLWFVSNRCETVCLDIGPLKQQPRGEPRIVWSVDMREKFGVFPTQPYMGPSCLCSIAPSYEGLIFVSTGNGVDSSNVNIPAPDAPGLICFDKNTGEAKWQVPTGENVLFSELASPLVAEIARRGQVIMPHGDGWVRSYDPQTGRLLWEFDVNFKESIYSMRGRSTRNYFLSTPVLYEDRIYIAGGMRLDVGEGDARLVCIDPTGTGDISSELAVDSDGNTIPPRRLQNVDADKGERAVPNSNSGLIWEYVTDDMNGDQKVDYEARMHRTMANVVIHDGLLVAGDIGGIVHCLDARTGDCHWTYDSFTQVVASPLIVGNTVYVATDEGSILLFRLSAEPGRALSNVNGELAPLADIHMLNTVYTAPIFVNGVLYVTNRHSLYAIQQTASER
jgi:outer membrane protein assembly factor BamB